MPPNLCTSAYYYFDRWKKGNLFDRINAALNQLDRHQAAREALPSALSVDTQLVKLTPMSGKFRRLDANKKINDGPPLRS